MKITNHHELRRRIAIDCSEPKMTDQSYKNLCDINNIMAAYAKTGLFGHLNSQQPIYIDNTLVPGLEAAFNIANTAMELFSDLPAEVRKLMDNDPRNLESFINNPDNADILLKTGVIVKTSEPKPTSEQLQTEMLAEIKKWKSNPQISDG